MSSFTGRREEPWSLSRTVDALAQAARAAGRPGWIWIAGMGYPTVGVGLGAGLSWMSFSRGHGLPVPGSPELAAILNGEVKVGEVLAGFVSFLPVFLVFFRLRVGLARIAPPTIWHQLKATFGKPRLRQAWRAGYGLTWSALGMAVMLTLMMLAAVGVIAVPLALFAEAIGDMARLPSTLFLILPGVFVMGAYALILSVLHQLALQSLAHNRRGVASALVHAWRIARNDPWATGRTLAVDLVLNVTIFIITVVLSVILSLTCLGEAAAAFVYVLLLGYMGVTRAGYWARAYRALGGLSPDDRVPGLGGEAIDFP